MVRVLHDRRYPVKELRLLASARSADRKIATPYGEIVAKPFSLEATQGCDVVLLAVSGDFAKEWAPKIAAQGATVIDNSSAWRYDPAIPLVVPEINAAAARGHKLIANPNCTTAVLVVALWPLAPGLRPEARDRLQLPGHVGRRRRGHGGAHGGHEGRDRRRTSR